MNKTCQNCGGKCCVGEIEVFPWDEVYSNPLFTVKVEDNGMRDEIMKTDPNNNCIALVAGVCIVYYKRPTVCREFTIDSPCCLKLMEGVKTKHDCEPCSLVQTILEKRNNESKRSETDN